VHWEYTFPHPWRRKYQQFYALCVKPVENRLKFKLHKVDFHIFFRDFYEIFTQQDNLRKGTTSFAKRGTLNSDLQIVPDLTNQLID
jgi:hypothetical protein